MSTLPGLLRIHDQIRAAAIIALTVLCTGCASRPSQGVLIPSAEATEGTSRIVVLAATTRGPATAESGDMFSTERADALSYASIAVSIPPNDVRRVGQIQWPASLPGDPSRDFVTTSADFLSNQSFAAAISAVAKETGRSRALIFVHGFNNRFDEAVYRLAQIVQDSKAPAIPVLFSWPSQGLVGLFAYQNDLANARNSRGSLDQVLDTVAQNRSIKEVTVVCHSMGCLPTLEALQSRSARSGKIGAKVKNVLLVAPDVDVEFFRTRMSQMGTARPRFALFLSRDDGALKISQLIAGGAKRLGDVNPEEEPFKSDFKREGVLAFDLTHLEGNAHSRAFDDVTTVMGMIERRLAEGQQFADAQTASAAAR